MTIRSRLFKLKIVCKNNKIGIPRAKWNFPQATDSSEPPCERGTLSLD